jgi:hypothetical protein
MGLAETTPKVLKGGTTTPYGQFGSSKTTSMGPNPYLFLFFGILEVTKPLPLGQTPTIFFFICLLGVPIDMNFVLYSI